MGLSISRSVPPQMIGTLNASLHGATEAAVVGTLAFCVDPSIPKNEGFHRHVEIICPKARSAARPRRSRPSTRPRARPRWVYRALMRAAAGATPEMSAAGSTLIQWSTYIGVDERNGDDKLWAYANFNECGGGGAASGVDGSPCMMEMGVAGAMTFMSTEMEEWLYPVLVKEQEIKTRFSRSRRVARRARRDNPRHRARLQRDGCLYRLLGAQQSEPRDRGRRWRHRRHDLCLRSAKPDEWHFYSGLGKFQLPKGWEYVVIASGGGGYGDPYDRDPAAVAADVRDEIVSIEAAQKDYGVVLDSETLAVDEGGDRGAPRQAQGRTRPRAAQLADGARHLDAPPEPDDKPRITFTDLDRDPAEDSSPDLYGR